MNLLEYYQDQHYFNESYILRKVQIPTKGDVNLYGVRGAGKSAMVLDLLNDEDTESTLYIDFDDPNLIFSTLTPLLLQQYP